MSLTLYNTLTGKKEEFKPLEAGKVRMYNCGPTVYNYVHIGNLLAYVFVDVLRRTLEWNGYKVMQVMNITDVGHLTSDADAGEDKMMRALKREGKPFTLQGMREIADIYTKAFKDNLRMLNIREPEYMPRASDHITEDIELVQELLKKGFAYNTADGIYFDTSKFPEYGKLGNINLEGQKAGARVETNPEKKNAIDFTLWKFAKPELPAFPSPFGPGFPGWHLECSAMSRKYIGQPFDIHTGGVDHIPTHHPNNIGQSEAAYGTVLARYWLHNEQLVVPAGKMAKSEGNAITLHTLRERGIHPLAYRYYVLQAHYRSPLNFSWSALESAQKSYFKLLLSLSPGLSHPLPSVSNSAIDSAIAADLDTPRILATVWELVKEKKYATVFDADRILGLDIKNQSRKLLEEMGAVPEEVKRLSLEREEAREREDFKKSDEIRVEIQKAGFEVMDTDSGPIVRKRM